ncbi:heat shock protein 70 family [Cladochytrium replicatum]|nr:heat shock protein 70 family [Cladochytrium replicatum]
MSVVGIDFGNLNTVVAVARNRGIDVIINEVSNRATPSLVSFGEKQRYLGESAKTQEISNFKNTVSGLKRLIGRPFSDPEIHSFEKPYINSRLSEPTGDDAADEVAARVMYQNEQRDFTFTQLTAMFLGKVKEFTHAEIKIPVNDVVISCPGWYTDRQRRALRDAAEIVGLNCVRVMNDLSAAALGYGITKTDLPDPSTNANAKPRTIVFVDLGHSSYQVAVVSFVKGKLTVKGTAYDRNLGGRDFDEILVQHYVKEFSAKYKIDIASNPKAVFRLRQGIEKVKKVLSANPITMLNVESLMDDKDVSAEVHRSHFLELAQSLVGRLIPPLEQALAAAGVTPDEVDFVELVGGSTRVQAVKETLAKFFGGSLDGAHKLSTTLNQDEAVARGCALQCAIISPVFKVRDFSVTDWNSYPVELEWDSSVVPPTKSGEPADCIMEAFPVGDKIPSTKTLTLYRTINETSGPFTFDLLARYSERGGLAGRNFPAGVGIGIGKFTLKGIKKIAERPGEQLVNNVVESTGVPKAQLKIKVRVDGSGILSVESAQQIEEVVVPVKEEAPAAAAGVKDAKENSAAPAAAPTPMETDDAAASGAASPDGAASPAPAETKTRKVQRKHELEVVSVLPAASLSALQKWQTLEGEMSASDRLVIDTMEKRNALEEYVYETRDKLDMAWSDFLTDALRASFQAELRATEDWLYTDEGESATKSVYSEKLAGLKKIGDPVAERYREAEERPRAEKQFREFVNSVILQATSGDEKYAHISKEELDKVVAEANAKLGWLNDSIAKQNEKGKHEELVVRVGTIQKERETLQYFVNPILNKPKPKVEKKAEPAKPAAKDEANGTKSSESEGGATPMDADGSAPELEVVDEKKEDMEID